MRYLRKNIDTDLLMLKDKFKKEEKQLFIKRFFSNKLILFGLSIILILLLLISVGPLIVPFDPYEMTVDDRLEKPSTEHWLGTDNLGRDLFARIAYGGKTSIGVGFSVALITSLIGMAIGLYASYYRVLDNILMRICDALMSFPAILLAIALMASLGPSTRNVIISLSIVYTPYVARVMRSAALVIKEQTYIEAMKAQGASSFRIIWGHIAPNTLTPIIVQATFIFSDAIIVETALSFLGAGVPAPDPSWGNILHDGKIVIFNAWWMVVFPGLSIILAVLGLNLFGDGLRDLLDPHDE